MSGRVSRMSRNQEEIDDDDSETSPRCNRKFTLLGPGASHVDDILLEVLLPGVEYGVHLLHLGR